MKKKKYIQILDQTEQIERILTKGDVNKCLDNAIMRCKALILSAKPPVITEVYLLQDLLETKALLNATKPLNHKEYMNKARQKEYKTQLLNMFKVLNELDNLNTPEWIEVKQKLEGKICCGKTIHFRWVNDQQT